MKRYPDLFTRPFTATLTATLLAAFALVPLASAQAFIVTPVEEAAEDTVFLNPFLELPLYPDAEVLSSEIEGRDSETRFRSSASLEEIYAFLHDFLIEAGWERTNLEEESSEIEATYRREGVSFEFELEREEAGVYKLEIDLED